MTCHTFSPFIFYLYMYMSMRSQLRPHNGHLIFWWVCLMCVANWLHWFLIYSAFPSHIFNLLTFSFSLLVAICVTCVCFAFIWSFLSLPFEYLLIVSNNSYPCYLKLTLLDKISDSVVTAREHETKWQVLKIGDPWLIHTNNNEYAFPRAYLVLWLIN